MNETGLNETQVLLIITYQQRKQRNNLLWHLPIEENVHNKTNYPHKMWQLQIIYFIQTDRFTL